MNSENKFGTGFLE